MRQLKAATDSWVQKFYCRWADAESADSVETHQVTSVETAAAPYELTEWDPVGKMSTRDAKNSVQKHQIWAYHWNQFPRYK